MIIDWIVAIIVGAFIGWIASIVMNTNDQQGAIANILIGIVGAALAKWVFSDVLGIGVAGGAGALTFWGIVWGLVGAIILIAVLRGVRVLR